jgi:hypothetical protein
MSKVVIKPYNVIDLSELPEMSVNQRPTDGDPMEIKGEMYYVCEIIPAHEPDNQEVGVIPLIVRNPASISNIEDYIRCLSLAHRKVLFKNEHGICDLDNCDEMVIT